METNKDSVVPAEEKVEGPENPQAVDFTAELENEKKRKRTPLEKALYARKQIDKEIEELGGTPTFERSEPSIDENTLDDLVGKKVELGLSRIQKTIFESQVRDAIGRRASSPAEAELALFHYQNSIIPSEDLNDDVEKVLALANAGRLKKERDEALRALQSKEHLNTIGSGGGQKVEPQASLELTPQEQSLARNFKLTPEEIIKARK